MIYAVMEKSRVFNRSAVLHFVAIIYLVLSIRNGLSTRNRLIYRANISTMDFLPGGDRSIRPELEIVYFEPSKSIRHVRLLVRRYFATRISYYGNSTATLN